MEKETFLHTLESRRKITRKVVEIVDADVDVDASADADADAAKSEEVKVKATAAVDAATEDEAHRAVTLNPKPANSRRATTSSSSSLPTTRTRR